MSEACVTDSFARAKEAWSGSIRSPYLPTEAQAAGRIHPLKVCVTAAAVVNPGRALRTSMQEAVGSHQSDAGYERQKTHLEYVGDCEAVIGHSYLIDASGFFRLRIQIALHLIGEIAKIGRGGRHFAR